MNRFEKEWQDKHYESIGPKHAWQFGWHKTHVPLVSRYMPVIQLVQLVCSTQVGQCWSHLEHMSPFILEDKIDIYWRNSI